MSQVNLLPPEILEGHRSRQIAALVGAACGLVLVLIFLFYALQSHRVSSVKHEVAAQELINENVQTQINALQSYATLQATAQEQEQLLESAYAGEVSFSRVLMDISRVIPNDMALDSLNVQLSAPATGTSTTTSTGPTVFVGTISTSGTAVNLQSIADWLTRLEQVDGWANPWASNATLEQDTQHYSFTSSVDLTDKVVTVRGKAGGVRVTGKRAPLIVGAVGLVLAVLMVMFLVLPKMHQVSEAKAARASAVDEQAVLQSKLGALEDAKNEAAKNQAIIDDVSARLPPTADEPGMMLLLSNAAADAGLPLTQFTPGAPTLDPTTGLSQIPVSLAVTGTYFELAQFLFNIETLPRVAKVESVNISSGGGGSSSAVPTLQMTGSVTFYTTDTNAGPGSQPGPTGANGSVASPLPSVPPATPSSSPSSSKSPGASASQSPSP